MSQDELKEGTIFWGHLMFLGVTLLLQTWSVFANQIKPDFVLVFLILSALFFDFPKIFLMTLISAFFMNWSSVVGLDLAVFAMLPIIISLTRKFIPGKMVMVGFALVFLGTAIFYSAINFSAFWGDGWLAGKIFLLNLLFGCVVFLLISKFLNPQR